MKEKSLSEVLESEVFGEGKRFYFVDLCLAVNHKVYLRITRSDRLEEEDGKVSYKRETVRVFEEELPMLIESLSTVFRRYNAQQR